MLCSFRLSAAALRKVGCCQPPSAAVTNSPDAIVGNDMHSPAVAALCTRLQQDFLVFCHLILCHGLCTWQQRVYHTNPAVAALRHMA